MHKNTNIFQHQPRNNSAVQEKEGARSHHIAIILHTLICNYYEQYLLYNNLFVILIFTSSIYKSNWLYSVGVFTKHFLLHKICVKRKSTAFNLCCSPKNSAKTTVHLNSKYKLSWNKNFYNTSIASKCSEELSSYSYSYNMVVL